MLRTTLSKIKKAWALALASRGRGDIRTFPSKFHKLSIAVLNAEKIPDSEKDKLEQCEKCKQLLDYIFGTSKQTSDVVQSKSEGTIPIYSYTKLKDGDKIEDGHAIIQARTSAHSEDQLTQKVEEIDETPLVEAERKNIDDVKPSPRVLGHIAEVAVVDENNRLVHDKVHGTPIKVEDKEINLDMRQKIDALVRRIEAAQLRKIGIAVDPREEDSKNPVLKFASDDSARSRKSGDTQEENEQNSFDAMAKRCLDTPTGRIDEHLLKEMKKYGVPQGSSNNSMIEIGVIKKRKPVEKTEFDLESSKSHNTPTTNTTPYAPNSPYGAYYNDPKYYNMSDFNVDGISESCGKDIPHTTHIQPTFQKKEQNMDKEEPRSKFNPNVPIIDPHDKKPLINENDTFKYPSVTFFESNEEKAAKEHTTALKEAPESIQQFHIPHPSHFPGYGMGNQSNTYYQNTEFQPDHWEEKPDPLKKDMKKGQQRKEQEESHTDTGYTQAQQNYYTPDWQQGLNYQPDKVPEQPGQVWPHYGYWPQESQPQNMQYCASHKLIEPELIAADSFPEPEKTSEKQYHTKTVDTDASINFSSSSGPIVTPKVSQANPKATPNILTPASATPNADSTTASAIQSMTSTLPTPIKEQQRTPKPVDTTAASICYLPKSTEILSEAPSEQISKTLLESVPLVNPLDKEPFVEPVKEKPMKHDLKEPSKLNMEGNVVPLSELLKRVRMRNRMEYCRLKEDLLDPVEGKCGKKKKPPCPPPAPTCSPCPPPCPKPQPPPCPRPCKQACPNPCPKVEPTCPPPAPTCPKPCQKMTPAFINLVTLLWNANSRPCMQYVPNMNTSHYSVKPLNMDELREKSISKQQCLEGSFQILSSCYMEWETFTRRRKIMENIALAREFEPWVPIPCWPIPKKKENKPLVCPKEGCKVIPPPRLNDPCDKSGNPCLNFPKRRNFSLSDIHIYARFIA